MTRPVVMALALSAGLCTQVFAQTDTSKTPAPTPVVPAAPAAVVASVPQTGVTIFGILSNPIGDFGDEDEGNYTTGFGAGAEIAIPLKTTPNTQVILGAYYVRNPLDLDEAEDQGVEFSEEGAFTNISIMGGARFMSAQNYPGFYVLGLAGLNFASSDDLEFTDPEFGSEYKGVVSSENSFGFVLGVGKKVGRFDISARYVNLGEPKFTLKYYEDGSLVDEVKTKLAISMLNFTVGYNF